jgi:hypothetical protein
VDGDGGACGIQFDVTGLGNSPIHGVISCASFKASSKGKNELKCL